MIATPNVLSDAPAAPTLPAESVDVLSDLLRAVRLSGQVLLRGDFSAPWAVQTPDAAQLARMLMPGARRLVSFHFVADGDCWIALHDGKRIALPRGTVVLLPYADVHTLGGGDGEPVPIVELLRVTPASKGVPVVVHGGGGAPTRLVCGFLNCDELLFNPVLKTLPPLLVAQTPPEVEQSLLAATVRHLVDEAEAPQAGGACLLARLAELMFIEVLRRHVASLSPEMPRWLGAVNDPMVGRALQALHAQPSHQWTVDSLARHVGTSRSLLATRFKTLVGEAPMHYLTRWRLQRAAQMLRDGRDGLATIAEQVGYESEAAFNRAFRRHAGESPGVAEQGGVRRSRADRGAA